MPKFRQPNRGRRAIPAMLPAPVGGLNGRDTFAAMPPTDAFVMDNWFPYNTSVDTRGGSEDFVTDINFAVESLEVYTGAAGSKMLAFAGGNVYDASTAGVAGAALLAGMLSSRMTSAMFSNAGAQFLVLYSGLDRPMAYNGVALTLLTITGLTGSQNTLHSPHVFKGRIFLAQDDQLGFYYLAPGAIQGAASYFDLSQVSLKGGNIAAISSFSQGDTGTGPQDYALFVTTEGEYILYAGTDPATAATWALVGRYFGPPPIGRKGWFKFRSDVYFITEEGVMAFAQIRQTGEGNATDEYITAKLGRNYTDLSQFDFVYGWSGIIYPRGNMLMVNVPVTGTVSGEYVQFAMNTNTNAWGRFKGIRSVCWALFERRAYFGTYDGRVVLFDEGFTDNGTEIQAVGRQAWNTFDDEEGIGVMDKQFHLASIVFKSDNAPSVAFSMNVNFQDDEPIAVGVAALTAGATWDLATWDVDYWAEAIISHSVEISIGKIGYVGSMWLEAASLSSRIQWIASRVLIEHTKRAFI